ncbi:hypothetical protein IG631_11079 [Alternaria alternata]|nr:hypothetical protein IG631_11079 [Alternaria alternata]
MGVFLAIEARRSKVVPGSMYFCEAMRTDQEICRHDRRSASLYMYGKWRKSSSHRRRRLCGGNNLSADRLGRCLISPTPQSKYAPALDSRYDLSISTVDFDRKVTTNRASPSRFSVSSPERLVGTDSSNHATSGDT